MTAGFVIETRREGGALCLLLLGRLRHGEVEALLAELEARRAGAAEWRLDLSGLEGVDGGAAAVLVEYLERGGRERTQTALAGAPEGIGRVLALYRTQGEAPSAAPARPSGLLEQVGRATLGLLDQARESLTFVGEATRAALLQIAHPRTLRLGALAKELERHGADALPIQLLIGFLIGLITAFQAAVQLAKVSADVFVADLVALSLTRELAPLLAAIVLAGRSGAAIAAELGTMRVSEEIDALQVMGICPYRYLVFPRVLALGLALPLLTLFSDAVGIFAGSLVATTSLDVGFTAYFRSARDALALADVFGGLLKALVFGFLIALVACERGLAARGGAEGVGRATTAAVVSTLFYLIVVDAAFTVLYKFLGV